ncbi:amidohydrolase [Lactococcus sp.]|uniref:amidohydrolase n=1 Tax=Lactococcus sp. TaxID=44273 RepID=UPI0035B13803
MSIQSVLSDLEEIKGWQEELYKDFHKHPELSMQEVETTSKIEKILKQCNFTVKKIGGGIVGILENGEGPKVLFRADIDALPVKEDSDVPYASTVEMTDLEGHLLPVMHACGHDFHITAGLGAAKMLSSHLSEWHGTYIALFQPGEEIAAGAKSMLKDDLINKIPKPDVALSQHVLNEPESGKVGTTAGPFLSTATSIKIHIKGKGAHGSMPHLSIDPVVIGSSIVMKLQTIVSREVNPFDFAVVTVGSFQSGLKANIIPDDATLELNIRAYSEDVKEHLISAIKRIALSECQAGNCTEEPTIEVYDNYPLTKNYEETTAKVTQAFKTNLGEDRVVDYKPMTASEDFSYLPDAWGIPYFYWGFGGFTKDQVAYPNHSPKFVPALQPTLTTGTQAAITAVLAFLGND